MEPMSDVGGAPSSAATQDVASVHSACFAGTGSGATRAAVVLAGGRSERFGSDKTRALVDGVPLLERVTRVVGEVVPPVDEVLVVGPWAPDGVRNVVEPDRFGGPLAALAFALGQVTAPVVLVLAADHPRLRPALLALVLDRLASDPDADAVVPVRDDRREPLVAAYRRSVADVADSVLAGPRASLNALLDSIAVVEVMEHEWRHVDRDGDSFRDVDTPDDLATSPKRGSASLDEVLGDGAAGTFGRVDDE